MYAAQLFLYDFHRREKRPFGTTGAQARRPPRNRFAKLLDRQKRLLSRQGLLSRQVLLSGRPWRRNRRIPRRQRILRPLFAGPLYFSAALGPPALPRPVPSA